MLRCYRLWLALLACAGLSMLAGCPTAKSPPETTSTPETEHVANGNGEGETPASTGENSSGSAETATGAAETPANLVKSQPRTLKTDVTMSGKKPAKDDTLLLYYGDDPDTLNLINANDSVSTAFQRLVYESLAEREMGDPSKWRPMLAESWTFDPDTLTFDIQLRKGVKWHPVKLPGPDGKTLPAEEFTARDVKFTFDCILNEYTEAASLRSYFTDPEATGDDKLKIELKVIDKYRVKIRWKKPYFMADEFTIGIPIMPRHVYGNDAKGEPISFDFRSKEFADGFNNHWANSTMCGTGPMTFQKWDKGVQTDLVRNDNYWGEPFYFSKIVYKSITNPQTVKQQLLQRDLDFGGIPDKDQYLQAKDHANVKSGEVVPREYQTTSYRYIGWNLKNPLFTDPKVRMALSHAVPVDQFIKNVYYGLAQRQTGPFVEGGAFANPNITPIPFDLDKAAKLLEEAGWKDTNSDGTLDKVIDGRKVEFKFDIIIFSEAPSYTTMAQIIQENLRKLGIQMTVTPTKWALMLQQLRKKEFDATILGWQADWKSDPFQIWHSSQADVVDSSNSISYRNPEVDKLIDELRITTDEARQTEIYHQIHQLIFDDQPYTFLFSEKATGLMHSRIDGWKEYPMLRPHLDSREWSASEARILGN